MYITFHSSLSVKPIFVFNRNSKLNHSYIHFIKLIYLRIFVYFRNILTPLDIVLNDKYHGNHFIKTS